MKRRGFLKSVASIPAFTVTPSLPDKNSTKVVVNMRFQKRMNSGSLRILKHGDVAKDIQIQNRRLWRMSTDYYSRKFGISIPSIRGFNLQKFLFHEGKFWSLAYQKPGYTLHLINSSDGPYRAMLYSIKEKENVAVAESNSFGEIVRKTRHLPQKQIESYNE